MAWKCHFKGQMTQDMIILTPDLCLSQKITLEKVPESTKVCQMYPQIKKKNTPKNWLKMRDQTHDSDDPPICNDMAIFDD